ncbi:DUF3108 domain-containing protein [Polaribacter sp.]|uniref:DUF3108 domain-containing protein n=1 Tax=Polaribacter sp. TaxID=1920175 RepID=UPI0040482916
MKKYLSIVVFLSILTLQGQDQKPAFKSGEWLRYKMSYSGFLRAGTAVLEVDEKEYQGKKVFHTRGTGWTSGMIKWFFEVDDYYESFFDKENIKPYVFKRKIYEGGYKKHTITTFNHDVKKAYVQDFTLQKDTLVAFNKVQDMLSSFYYLRSLDISKIKVGDEIKLDMFFDEETFPFRLKFLGKQSLRTHIGKVETLVFRPYVLSGRVFKEQESVTIWISNDTNKIPLKLKADLRVGSLTAELEDYRGLANPFVKQLSKL